MDIFLDKLSIEQRRINIKAVKAKDSKIEPNLSKVLWDKGCRYRKM